MTYLLFPCLLFLLVNLSAGRSSHATGDIEALRQCGNLHHLNMHHFANSHAEYSQFECAVQCTIDGHTQVPDAINEGYPCPLNSHGHCRKGLCNVQTTPHQIGDPVRECGNIHRIDFHGMNMSGTAYTNQGCILICAISGQIASWNLINEGFTCPENRDGICEEGECLLSHKTVTIEPSTVTPTRIVPKTTQTKALTKATTPTRAPTSATPPTRPPETKMDFVVIRFLSGNFSRAYDLKTYASVCLKSHSDVAFNLNTCHQDCNQISTPASDPKSPTWDNTTPCRLSNYYGANFIANYHFLFNVWELSAYKYPVGYFLLSVSNVLTRIEGEPGHGRITTKEYTILMANLTLPLFKGDDTVGHLLVEFEFRFRH